MNDLAAMIAFYRARLDEDERIARAAIDERANGEPESWHWECTADDTPVDVDLAIASNDEFLQHGDHYRVGLRSTVDYAPPSPYEDAFRLSYGHLIIADEEVRPQDARHIARHDPARALREVEARRKILRLHVPLEPEYHLSRKVIRCAVCMRERDGWKEDWHADEWPCATIRADVAVYSDHPDYDPAWAAE